MSQLRPAERAATCAAAQHGHITSEQCRDCGLSPSAVRRLVARGAWERVAPGVYRIVGVPPTWHGRALAAVLAAGPEALASHRTAAHLWGLEGFGPPGRIEVTVRRHSRPRQRSNVTVHETLAFDPTAPRVRWGVPTVGPARGLVDLAGIGCGELVLLRALDEVRRLHLASWPTLWEAFVLHAHRGRPGIVACRSVLLRRWAGGCPTRSSLACSDASSTTPAFRSRCSSTPSRPAARTTASTWRIPPPGSPSSSTARVMRRRRPSSPIASARTGSS